MKNIYHEYSLILMKTEETNEKNAEKSRGRTPKITHNSVVLKVPYSAKPDFKLMLRHSIFTQMIQFIIHQI